MPHLVGIFVRHDEEFRHEFRRKGSPIPILLHRFFKRQEIGEHKEFRELKRLHPGLHHGPEAVPPLVPREQFVRQDAGQGGKVGLHRHGV